MGCKYLLVPLLLLPIPILQIPPDSGLEYRGDLIFGHEFLDALEFLFELGLLLALLLKNGSDGVHGVRELEAAEQYVDYSKQILYIALRYYISVSHSN